MKKEDKIVMFNIDKEYVFFITPLLDKLKNLTSNILTHTETREKMKSFNMNEDGSIINIDIPLSSIEIMELHNDDVERKKDDCDRVFARLSVFVK